MIKVLLGLYLHCIANASELPLPIAWSMNHSVYDRGSPTAVHYGTSTSDVHYGPPPCLTDEVELSVDEGMRNCGKRCSSIDDCPADHPEGMTADLRCDGVCYHAGCDHKSQCGFPGNPSAICTTYESRRICANTDNSIAGCKLSDCITPGCFKMFGAWVQISESSGKQTVSIEQGVTRSYTVDDTDTWGASFTTSVKAGFDVKLFSSSIEVTGEASYTLAQEYSQTFSMTSTQTFQDSFDAGVIWQWQWSSDEPCGKTTSMGRDLMLTDGAFDPPCCVPGYFRNISNPHGECHEAADGKLNNLCDSADMMTAKNLTLV